MLVCEMGMMPGDGGAHLPRLAGGKHAVRSPPGQLPLAEGAGQAQLPRPRGSCTLRARAHSLGCETLSTQWHGSLCQLRLAA